MNSTARLTLCSAFSLVLAATSPARPQQTLPQNGSARFTGEAKSSGWLPMDFYLERYIYLRGKLAGVETDIVLDSGAGGTVVDTALASRLGLSGSGGVVAKGVGGNQPASLLQGLELELGGLTLSGILGVGIDLTGVGAMLGRGMPVILGKDAFQLTIVDIDYPNRRVAFHRREDFAYAGPGKSVPLELTPAGLCTLQIGLEGRTAVVQVDTGSGGALDVFAHFAAEHELLNARSPTSRSQGGGVGGRIHTTVATLETLTLAGFELRSVPCSFPETEEGVFATSSLDGNLGSAVLGRFRLVFDYGRRALHVEPGAGWDSAPFRKNRVGLEGQFEDGALAVVFVAPGSPAAKAGIAVGQRIRALGGTPVTGADWRALLSAWGSVAAGSEVVLEDVEGRRHTLVAADYY